jgi:hypothetical protein
MTRPTAADRLAEINAALAAGRTVFICTYTRATQITAKTAAKWAAAGTPLFKLIGESLYMASGRKFACIDYTDTIVR